MLSTPGIGSGLDISSIIDQLMAIDDAADIETRSNPRGTQHVNDSSVVCGPPSECETKPLNGYLISNVSNFGARNCGRQGCDQRNEETWSASGPGCSQTRALIKDLATLAPIRSDMVNASSGGI